MLGKISEKVATPSEFLMHYKKVSCSAENQKFSPLFDFKMIGLRHLRCV